MVDCLQGGDASRCHYVRQIADWSEQIFACSRCVSKHFDQVMFAIRDCSGVKCAFVVGRICGLISNECCRCVVRLHATVAHLFRVCAIQMFSVRNMSNNECFGALVGSCFACLRFRICSCATLFVRFSLNSQQVLRLMCVFRSK